MTGTVLVIRWSHVGDVVLTSPATDALKAAWPEARLVFATNRGFGDLVRFDPNIAAVIERESGEKDAAFATRVRTEHAPEAVLDLHGVVRNFFLRLGTGARRIATFRRRPLLDELTVNWTKLRRYRGKMLISERYHLAAEKLAGKKLPKGRLTLHVGPAHDAAAEAAMRAAGLDLARPIVGMSPGANFATKRWPLDRWVEISTRARAKGWQVVATGSEAEKPLGKTLAEAGAADLTGKLALGALGGVIRRCSAYLANDSGPMHMARALQVPTLAFFGSTDPAQFEFTGHALQWAGVECAPCSLWGLEKCPQGHFRCMLDLDVERAWTALEGLVAGPRRLAILRG